MQQIPVLEAVALLEAQATAASPFLLGLPRLDRRRLASPAGVTSEANLPASRLRRAAELLRLR